MEFQETDYMVAAAFIKAREAASAASNRYMETGTGADYQAAKQAQSAMYRARRAVVGLLNHAPALFDKLIDAAEARQAGLQNLQNAG